MIPLLAAAYLLNPKALCAVPIEIHNMHVYVPVVFGGKARLSFLLDSGAAASLNILDQTRASKLGVKVEGSGHAGAIGGGAKIAFANAVDLSIPPVHLTPNRVALMDLAGGQSQEGHAVDGMLGYAFFRSYIVQIDYPGRKLRLFANGDRPVSRENASTTRVPLTIWKRNCVISADLDFGPGAKSVPVRLIIDTGYDGTIMLTSPFARKHGLLTGKGTTGVGLGGNTSAQNIRLRDITIGGTRHIRNFVARSSSDREGAFSSTEVDGYIGGGVLRAFVVTFDYRRGELLMTRREG